MKVRVTRSQGRFFRPRTYKDIHDALVEACKGHQTKPAEGQFSLVARLSVKDPRIAWRLVCEDGVIRRNTDLCGLLGIDEFELVALEVATWE